MAAGALAGAGAVYFTLSALDARSSFETSVDDAVANGTAPEWSLQDEQHRHERWAQVLGVTSGALLVSGALVLLLAPAPQSGNAKLAQLHVQPGLIAATYYQSF